MEWKQYIINEFLKISACTIVISWVNDDGGGVLQKTNVLSCKALLDKWWHAAHFIKSMLFGTL